MIRVDLHSHSTCSDGTFCPAHTVRLAHDAGIDIFALTDHDTISGIDEARQMADELGMRLINGVEISCHHQISGGYGKNQTTTKTIIYLLLTLPTKNA